MKSVVFVVLAVLACFVCAHEIPEGEGIYRLTASNLTLAKTGDWLLIFYAPWCSHCRVLLGKLPELAKEIKGSVKIGLVDADAEPAVQMQFSMHGFPSLFMAHEGDVYPFPDMLGRSVETLSKWSKKDYAEGTPMSGIKAPFGIAMRAFTAYSTFAIRVYRFLEVYANKLNIPPMWFFCGVAVSLALIVIVTMILTSRLRRSTKKPAAQRKNAPSKNPDAEISAPIVQRARAENPIEGAAVAETEKVQEKVKKAKEEQKLRRRGMNKDEAGIREQQKKSQKGNKSKSSKTVRQQNMPTQQPSKRS